jgi:hypothetical protein
MRVSGFACQWPGCPLFATSTMRRGESMPSINLCRQHALYFDVMSNADCADIARRAKPPKSIRCSADYAQSADVEIRPEIRPRVNGLQDLVKGARRIA